VFLLNAPIGLGLSFLAMRVLAEPAHGRAPTRQGAGLDYVGLALLVIGMCALQIVLDKGQEDDWFASAFITALSITAAVGLTAFVLRECRRADPIVDLSLLADRSFAIGNLLMFMLGFVLLASTVLLPLFVQSVLGYTATQAGLVISPGGFALMLAMPLVGAIVDKLDARWLIAAGLVATALALFHMTRFDADIDYATVAWARIYQSLGLALLFIPINTVAYSGVPAEKNANASALINMMRNLGGSVGIAALTTFVARREQFHQSVLVERVNPYSLPYHQTVGNLEQATLAHHGSAVGALQQAQALIAAMVQKQAMALSYIDGFWLMGVILLALLALVFAMRKAAPGAASPPAH
jgi:DHA2 family multidrug resistance protein